MIKSIFLSGAIVALGSLTGLQLFTRTPTNIEVRDSIISGIVVPHHDLVKKRREALFSTVAQRLDTTNIHTVIIVSPNHFNAGKAHIQISDRIWETADGNVQPNKETLNALEAAHAAVKKPSSFDKEHGIKLILGDIKRTFPHAQIVPIILTMDTTDTEVRRLHDVLADTCGECIMVASVDFSHYQGAALARLHDNLSIRALQQVDSVTLMTKAETDSPAALNLLTRWAKSRGTEKFILFDHTNSGILAHNVDMETTTHVFGWYERGPQVTGTHEVSFMLGGDMMFGRFVAHTYLKSGFEKLFDRLGERVFWGTDASLVNLEGPISDKPVPDDTEPNNLVFNFPPQTLHALRFLHISGVSLANNHTFNQGKKGLTTTRRLLHEAGILAIGDPKNVENVTVGHIQGNGITLHVIGIHALDVDTKDITTLIRDLKKDSNQRVLIFPHWGVEYARIHSPQQEKLAKRWIDAGADIVVGAHPHVIQDMEVYRGKPIVYSMGNLVFDQMFSPQTQEGILVAGSFTDEGLELFILPHHAVRMKPEISRGKEKKRILDTLYAGMKDFLRQTEVGPILFFPLHE